MNRGRLWTLAGLFCLGSLPNPLGGAPAAAATGPREARTITVLPARDLRDGQTVKVSWSGAASDMDRGHATLHLEECRLVVRDVSTDCDLLTEQNVDPGPYGHGTVSFVVADESRPGSHISCPCMVTSRDNWQNADHSLVGFPIHFAGAGARTPRASAKRALPVGSIALAAAAVATVLAMGRWLLRRRAAAR
ncbi:MAG: hypothetical protein ACYDAD_06905 [Acidimicrobiales bacterium]